MSLAAGQPRDRFQTDLPTTVVPMNVKSPGWPATERKATPFSLLNLATLGFVVAWLAVACYAVAYLISR